MAPRTKQPVTTPAGDFFASGLALAKAENAGNSQPDIPVAGATPPPPVISPILRPEPELDDMGKRCEALLADIESFTRALELVSDFAPSRISALKENIAVRAHSLLVDYGRYYQTAESSWRQKCNAEYDPKAIEAKIKAREVEIKRILETNGLTTHFLNGVIGSDEKIRRLKWELGNARSLRHNMEKEFTATNCALIAGWPVRPHSKAITAARKIANCPLEMDEKGIIWPGK